MKLRPPISNRCGRNVAFTLVEIILAISIAIGILVVALYFHGQATNLRAQLLEESDRISAIRLVMDRLTSELRNAFAQPQYGFTGDATSLRFVTTELPLRPNSIAHSSIRQAAPRTDLRLVSYALSTTLEGTNEVVTGLTRTEQLLLEKPDSTSAFALSSRTESIPGGAGVLAGSVNTPARGPEPITEAIRFLRIWYWDGSGWEETWDSSQLPRAVEITLAGEPWPADASTADYPGELFRRTIYLPTSREIDSLVDSTEVASSNTAPKP